MKKVTLKQAVLSGRRFRYVGPEDPAGHKATTGHVWRTYDPGFALPEGWLPLGLACSHCDTERIGLKNDRPDEWSVERTEDEFEADALEIINGLGLTMRQAEKV